MLQKDIFRITPRLYIEKSVPSAKARCGAVAPQTVSTFIWPERLR